MNKNGFVPVVAVVIIAVAVLVAGGASIYILMHRAEFTSPAEQASGKVFQTEELCESSTGKQCAYVMCDMDCPENFQKGWTTSDDLTARTYVNKTYGFKVYLPMNWSGFSIVNNQKDIYAANASSGTGVIGHFPMIEIVHPSSTAAAPMQNIPIFAFTQDQWRHIGNDNADWGVGAAPIPPSELGENSSYVFALPARYNYAFLPGWEEVREILDRKPLKAFELSGASSTVGSPTLLKVGVTGGLCVFGACGSETSIYENGKYISKSGSGVENRGIFTSDQIDILKQLIHSADFASIKSKKFTDTCPVAYDGQELTYTFYSPEETLSSCEFVIDINAPLFKFVHILLSTASSDSAIEQ